MPISYVASLDLKILSEELQKNIEKKQKETPLREELILLPNQNLKKWLQIHLTDSAKGSITMNLRYSFLDAFLKELSFLVNGFKKIGDKDFFLPPNSRVPLSSDEFLPLILSKLQEASRKEETFWLANYLKQIPKLYALAKTLSSLFRDYELNRMGWIQAWAKEHNRNLFSKDIQFPFKPDPKQANDEYYQIEKTIYQSLFCSSESSAFSLYSFYTQTLLNDSLALPQSLGGIHLFCLANLSQTHLQILAALSKKGLDLTIYHFYHGNLKLGSETGIAKWAKPHAKFASEIFKIKPTPSNDLKEGPSQAAVPKGIQKLRSLLNQEPNSLVIEETDHSVRFWNAPSTYREMEIVANDILYKIQNKGCRYSDFVILLPNPQEYLSPIQWAFDGGILIVSKDNTLHRKKIPYSISDLSFKESSSTYQLLSHLFTAFDSNGFSLRTFIDLLSNPTLTGKKLAYDEIKSLESLLNELGVLSERGISVNAGLEKDRFQISYGINRLALSLVLKESSGRDWDVETISNVNESEAILLIDAWENLSQIRQNFFNLAKSKTINSQFVEEFSLLVREFFSKSSLDSMEGLALNVFLKKLSFFQNIALSDESDVLALLSEILQDCFEELTPTKGRYLTEGVTISMLQPSRPLPFKHLYILGLGEGKFPGKTNKSSFNLRFSYPEDWDLEGRTVKESILWENLHSTQESITLSYVGKDTKEDKVFEPSPSYLLLLRGLFEETEKEDYRKKIIEFPLVSYSPRYNKDTNSMEAGLVSFDASQSHVYGKKVLENPLGVVTKPELEPTEIDKSVIRESELISYWKEPLESKLKKSMGMNLEDEGEGDTDGNRFTLSALLNSAIEKKVLERIYPTLVEEENDQITEKTIIDWVDEITLVEIRKSQFPQSVFAELQKLSLIENIYGYLKKLMQWKQEFSWGGKATYHSFVQFGETGLAPELSTINLGSIPIDGKVNLVAEFTYFIQKGDTFFMLFPNSMDDKLTKTDDYNSYSDFYGKQAKPFFAKLCFGIKGKELKILPIKKDIKLNFDFSSNPNLGSAFLKKLTESYLATESKFFSRFGFQNFAFQEKIENLKAEKTKSGEWKTKWREFREENFDFLVSKAGSLTQLNRRALASSRDDSNDIFEISFIEEFYLPFLETIQLSAIPKLEIA